MSDKKRLHAAVDSLFKYKDSTAECAGEVASFQQLVTEITGRILVDLSANLESKRDMEHWAD